MGLTCTSTLPFKDDDEGTATVLDPASWADSPLCFVACNNIRDFCLL